MKLQRNKSVIDWRVLETKEKKKAASGCKTDWIKELHSFRCKSLLANGCRPRSFCTDLKISVRSFCSAK